ncbi:MAG TPA: hypothetical protein DCM73_14890 [Clostridiales bacterium]|nr:hypothetical protein [Clostridiales bacterium]
MGSDNKFINGYGVIQDKEGYGTSIKNGLVDKNYNIVLKPDTYLQIEFDSIDKNILYAYTDIYYRYGDIYKITDNGLIKITSEPYYMNLLYFISANAYGPYSYSYFNNSSVIAVAKVGPQFGVINRNGQIIIPFSSDYYCATSGNLIMKYRTEQTEVGNKVALKEGKILDDKGNIVTHSTYDWIDIFLESSETKDNVVAIVVYKDGKVNLLNTNDYQEVFDWSNNSFRVYENHIIAKNSEGKTGILDKNMKIVIDYIYDEIIWTEEDGFLGYTDSVIENIKLPDKTPVKSVNLDVSAKLPTFDITLNGVKIQNDTRLYPFIVYNDITYFPMTYYDSRFLNLKTEWSTTTGLKVSKANESSGYITDTTKMKHPNTVKPTIADFDIYINNQKIDNENEPYPLLIYKDITYFPMTWRFGVDEFGWDYKYTNDKGLQINSQILK